jgi:hypothetical protein
MHNKDVFIGGFHDHFADWTVLSIAYVWAIVLHPVDESLFPEAGIHGSVKEGRKEGRKEGFAKLLQDGGNDK